MRVEVNGGHVLAVVITILAWVFGLPWFFAIPAALILLAGVCKATTFLNQIGEATDD